MPPRPAPTAALPAPTFSAKAAASQPALALRVTFCIEFQTPGWCSHFSTSPPELVRARKALSLQDTHPNKNSVNKQAPCQGGIRSLGDKEGVLGKWQLFELISRVLWALIPLWLPPHLCGWANTHTKPSPLVPYAYTHYLLTANLSALPPYVPTNCCTIMHLNTTAHSGDAGERTEAFKLNSLIFLTATWRWRKQKD